MTSSFTLEIPYRVASEYAVYIEGEPDRIDLVVEHLRETLMRDRHRIATPIANWLGVSAPRIEIAPRESVPPLQSREVLVATGLDAARDAIIERATHVATISVALEPQPPRIALWGSYALACAIADAYEGVIEDRAAFRVIARERRDDALRGSESESVAPFVTVIFGRANDGSVSATTLGLSRYGLPDVALATVPTAASGGESVRSRPSMGFADTSASGASQIAWFLHATAQYLVDEIASSSGRREVPACVTLDGARFARAASRENAVPGLEIEVAFALSADARSISIGPPDGVDENEWLVRGLAPIGFPNDDRTGSNANDDHPEMDAAMTRARATLSSAKSAYNERNELTYVKRRFAARAGRDEYIWIAIDRWNGTTIVGRLANTPLGDVGYALDQRIEFDESEAVDWIVSSRDGTRTGNFTGAVIAAREGSRARGA